MKQFISKVIQSLFGKRTEPVVVLPELVVEPVVVAPVIRKPEPSNRKPGPKRQVPVKGTPSVVAKPKRVYNKPKKKVS
jgi:hypothetical protein